MYSVFSVVVSSPPALVAVVVDVVALVPVVCLALAWRALSALLGSPVDGLAAGCVFSVAAFVLFVLSVVVFSLPSPSAAVLEGIAGPTPGARANPFMLSRVG